MNITWFILIILLFVIIPQNNKQMQNIILKNKRRKGVKRSMPKELIKEFIGKNCSISLFNETFGITGKIVAVEENWLKVEEKNNIQLINGDMIRNITILHEKKKN